MASDEFSGKVALITGASSGIGRATAVRLGRAVRMLCLVARDGKRLEALAEELGNDTWLSSYRADLADPAQRAGVVPACVERFGRLDVLVNAAGVIGTGTLAKTEPRDLGFNARDQPPRHRRAHARGDPPPRGDGRLHRQPVLGRGTARFSRASLAYAVSKAAVDQLTHCAALELGPQGRARQRRHPGRRGHRAAPPRVHGREDVRGVSRALQGDPPARPRRTARGGRRRHRLPRLARAPPGSPASRLPVDGGRSQTCFR